MTTVSRMTCDACAPFRLTQRHWFRCDDCGTEMCAHLIASRMGGTVPIMILCRDCVDRPYGPRPTPEPPPPIAGGSDLSLPGEPSAAEVAARADAILARVRALSAILAANRVPADATTACALLVLGTSILCLPGSPIAPEFVDALVEEMKDLGRAHGRALTIRLRGANGDP